ncbi:MULTISPECIES: N-6 DNA methylase [Bacteroides]|uniref:N-6 DNA methylase n=1 Tax=Bacteroides TaxID=816 RepID=UPI00189DA228|nr:MULTISPECIES: N-6 DNA methylase [Bacteroides]MDC1767539.1 N-6 DNA methylase [Bacteroides uniformis]MDC1771163.1 N-6 DNA methylase [Bacteroides uniformis]MDC1777125.1 N-6 DNA methylase [Bacteroides uniformis]MDC1778700.1 N-6 DNA methylase [Bacteroides uniformis]
MYAIIPQQIPQGKRAEVNEKILFAIGSGKDLIPAESIYNCYTGIGGLHNLRQSDFANYNEYAQAKKEFEMGQFFTPHEVCRDMVDMLSPASSEMVLDMCCGMCNFFNHLPNLHNAYGFDIDGKAVAVARYLYPEAHIEKCDIRQYRPEQRFDVIIGNPPFNLKFDYKLSQEYYMDKAYNVLNPAGILMLIVPLSFMQNEFWEKSRVANVNDNFSFIGQTRLNPSSFVPVGVHNFSTKVMVFLRKSLHVEMQPYNADEFISMDELKGRIREARAMKQRMRLDLMRETNRIDKEELELFEYRLAKYMYELKAHAALNRHIDKAEALVTKFRNQKPPENATNEQVKEWERKKLTTKKVLSVIRRYITSQNIVPRKEVALVKTSYGFRLKQYAPRLLDKIQHKTSGINDLVLGRTKLPVPEILTEKNMIQIRAAEKLIRKKRRQYEIQNRQFCDMNPDPALAEYLDRATFINKDGETCEFTPLQKHDLNLVLQKRYALLNWQQGSGKTAAVYHRAKYLLKYRKVRNAIILAPAIATNMTWMPFLTINKERFRMVRNNADLETVPEGVFLVFSTSMLGKLKRGLTKFIRRTSGKLCLVFDESDEITNPSSQRTRHILTIFRRLKYKILDTGTTTRNNIAELYSQFELLYNNSINMICWCSRIYHENKDKEIEEDSNPHYGEPFPAFRGHILFRACHCPGKATVFGIEKQNQDVYNKDELSELIGKTVITRKFKDFAGEKYEVRTHTVTPSEGEHEVYRVIIEEFCRICELYYNSTGDTKKDAGLRLMRQIKLLIKACSVPHLIEGYFGNGRPNKTVYIEKLIRKIPGKVAVGCTSIAAFELYESHIRERFPERPIYTVKGDVAFKKRQSIVSEFDSTINGILICTQQSLSSSVNIPSCNDVILESLQWNIPKMEQFYFRFIRLDSKELKNVHFVTYKDSVEQNLMALVLTKERLNEFIKTGEVKEQSEIFEEFDVTMSVIDSLLVRERDSEGKIHISWGSQRIMS